MKASTKMGLIAGTQLLVGAFALAFSPGAGKVPLGTLLLVTGAITALFAIRRRANAN